MKVSLRNLFQTGGEKSVLAFHENYFTPVDRSLPEDIFLAGYPKSGNTWFQDMVASLVFGIIPDHSPPRLVFDLLPDVHEKPYYIRYQTPTFFKTHFKPLPHYRNVVYLLRDGRDAMVSYWHHINALRREEVDFLAMVRTGTYLFPCKWHEHVDAWMANPYKARMMIIKYEDLLVDPVLQLKRFCAFAEIRAEDSYLAAIADGNSFKKLRRREQEKGVGNPDWPREKLFRRRGVSGSFRDEMPPEVLRAFLSEAGETLEKKGYLL